MRFYPPGRPDLLTRFVLDALRVLDQVEDGHRAVSVYRMEDRLPLVRSKTLVLVGSEDSVARPCVDDLALLLQDGRVRLIEGGMVPMVDQMPEEFAAAVLEFLLEV